ncbi:MAG: SDR family NAD(P)-dependent oxidoreductase [Halanaeroarchaeum sp.]
MSASQPEVIAGLESRQFDDAVILVTGATDGVGREAALGFGRLGATVLAHGRSPEKADSLDRELSATNAADVQTFVADFEHLEEVRKLAASVREQTDRVDVLVNNAGAFFSAAALTDLGVERTFVVNHLAPFVLTHDLLALIEESEGRIVNTASAIHRRGDFDLDELTTVDGYDGMDAYARSKRANVEFTLALADRLEDATTTCFHPGFIPGSGLYREGSLPVRLLMKALDGLPLALTRRFVSTPADGAAAALSLALSPQWESVNGTYFDRTEPADPSTRGEAFRERLWEWSEAVSDVEWNGPNE